MASDVSMSSNAGTPVITRRSRVGTLVEEDFLHAVDFGDVNVIKKILEENPGLNVDCTDALGRTPLRLAVKNENKELVETLLNLSSTDNIHEALLQAIDAGFTSIAETTLKHPRHMEMTNRRRRMGDVEGFFKPELGSQFPSYVTPLNLAAQKEQYIIVSLLLQRGETIPKPHKFVCTCQECLNKRKFDQLRMAKCRLDAYRGLASEAYICLCSQDPFLTAMELADELRNLAKTENIFKAEYSCLVDQLSAYVVKLLDRVWTQRELSVVLDKTGSPGEDQYESLARLRMAVEFQQKRFVAHPNCQQRIIQCWYKGIGKLKKATWSKKIGISCLATLVYPFAAIVFLVMPNSKCGRFISLPSIKFLSHTASFLNFLTLIIVSSRETISLISNTNTLKRRFPDIHDKYLNFREETGRDACGPDFPLRTHHPTVTEIMITTWLVGLIVQECQEIWESGHKIYFNDGYNNMDFLLLSVYTATYTLRYWVMSRWDHAIQMLGSDIDLTKDPDKTETYIYWLNADRRYWEMTDPMNMAEGLFAMANIISMGRITYILPSNEILGPLQISLGRMINDILRFFGLVAIFFLPYVVALRNLFWYYAHKENIELDHTHRETPPAVQYYGSELASFRTAFWSVYGKGGPKSYSLGVYNNTVTEDIAEGIDASYHLTMIILLMNMLIAMMSRSFDEIAEDTDVQWKFARSALFLDYIKDGGRTLPAPLNLLEIPHSIIRHCLRKLSAYTKKKNEPEDIQEPHPGRRAAAIFNTRSSQLKRHFGTGEHGSFESKGKPPGLSPFIFKTKRKSTYTTLYADVIQSIVQRYIYDVQREMEPGANAEEVKNSLEQMERDVMCQWEKQEDGVRSARQTLHSVAKELQNITKETSASFMDMLCFEMSSSNASTPLDDNSEGYSLDATPSVSTGEVFVHLESQPREFGKIEEENNEDRLRQSQDREGRHREPQDREDRHREPQDREDRHRQSQDREDRHRQSQDREDRHRQPQDREDRSTREQQKIDQQLERSRQQEQRQNNKKGQLQDDRQKETGEREDRMIELEDWKKSNQQIIDNGQKETGFKETQMNGKQPEENGGEEGGYIERGLAEDQEQRNRKYKYLPEDDHLDVDEDSLRVFEESEGKEDEAGSLIDEILALMDDPDVSEDTM